MSVLSFLLVYWKRYWKLFMLAIACLSVEACCDLLQPTIISKIVDVGVRNQQLAYVFRMSGFMLLVTCVGAFGAIGRNQLASRVSQHFSTDLRLDFFKKINGMSFEKLGQFEAATLMTRITNDISQLQNFANGLMRIFIKSPIVCIGAVIMVFRLNFRLALILLVVIPVISILLYTSLKLALPYFTRLQKMLDRLNSVVREYLSGVRVVKAFNTFDFEVARYNTANENLSNTAISAQRTLAIFGPLISLCVNMSVVFLLWIAYPLIQDSTLKVGQIIAFINYMTQILFSLNVIFNVYQQLIRAKASADRVGEVLIDKPDDKPEPNGTLNPSGIKGRVKFNHVTFAYPNTSGVPVLKELDFEISPRETVAIIGSTGSGKTSLINLIPGFYFAEEGSVCIDGAAVQDYNLSELREAISVVTQKVQLFTGTIAENIRWGKMDASDDDVVAAAKAAQAHDFIMSFPDGYNTFLGQNGVNLSGGQKQRVSIARALVRSSKILILDDCVSAVDVATEAAIMKALNSYKDRSTCILITQRISSVINLPKIIVLDEGRVAGIGNHKELYESCDVYKEICHSQFGKGVSA